MYASQDITTSLEITESVTVSRWHAHYGIYIGNILLGNILSSNPVTATQRAYFLI